LRTYYTHDAGGNIQAEKPESPEGPQGESLDHCMAQGRKLPVARSDDAKPYLYNQPIRMPPTLEYTYKGRGMIASILVFNLALAHHLLFLERGQASKGFSSLRKAQMLYELAFDFQKNEYFDSNYTFVLATVNNIALIHQQLDEGNQANHSLEQVLSILMFMIDGDGATINSDGRLDGFYHNLSSLENFHPGAAAAYRAPRLAFWPSGSAKQNDTLRILIIQIFAYSSTRLFNQSLT
jgi:hypothetical protein